VTDDAFVEALLRGERRALARSLTWAENSTAEARDLLPRIYPRTGHAHVVGITGAGGAGKSTLVNALALQLRRDGRTVGIIAVDPSSPFTRGAILGDRIRMQELTGDSGVFIRSMAGRGAIGGLAATTGDAVALMDAAGFDVVIVETIGAGQDEVEIVRVAETVTLVLNPNAGDEIQSLKAGILEIADVILVNKADLPGADQVVANLKMLMGLVAEQAWKVPVVKTIGTSGEGVPAAIEAFSQHCAFLAGSGEGGRRATDRARYQVERLVRDELYARTAGQAEAVIDAAVAGVAARQADPRTAAAAAVQQLLASRA